MTRSMYLISCCRYPRVITSADIDRYIISYIDLRYWYSSYAFIRLVVLSGKVILYIISELGWYSCVTLDDVHIFYLLSFEM